MLSFFMFNLHSREMKKILNFSTRRVFLNHILTSEQNEHVMWLQQAVLPHFLMCSLSDSITVDNNYVTFY